jgi:hypothetical protein
MMYRSLDKISLTLNIIYSGWHTVPCFQHHPCRKTYGEVARDAHRVNISSSRRAKGGRS